MAKAPTQKPEAKAHVEASVDATDTAPTTFAAPASDTPEPVAQRLLTSTTRVSLATLNAAAYKAHAEDADRRRKAAEVGVRAMQAALAKAGV